MAAPQQFTITLTSDQVQKLQELQKLTGDDTTNLFRTALQLYYEKIIADEDMKELAQINALLDVQ
ncbi:MAG: ribbon-helix-helix protein, CopG family [Sulfurovum sp.]|nr:ribbon-helix-helix protein, CopG family [Sulfurovum sp.]MCB4747966.1 ribbon-helix-helix protein, CopG family [Sulfurovum sp.]MCB4749117.1 ribbon-helix-helix protein, CopG family [Sulfurovum sp.]MCB4753920.1 ribbon-helix-helix protein, CopG family [Sulfurovum sp.]MCB4761744.1 ribbon-helix-helix protein, CopG family [Sulfurovum sp.]